MKSIGTTCIIMMTALIISCGQSNNFTEFVQCFPERPLPYTYAGNDWKTISPKLALKYLCDNDSTLLSWEQIGVDQETGKVVYKHLKHYVYKGYAKFSYGDYLILIYNEYNRDGLNEHNSFSSVGLYSKNGKRLDEKLFFVYDDRGKSAEQTGTIDASYNVVIVRREYVKNEKGVFTKSYKEISSTYQIDETSNKFKLVKEVTVVK